MCGPYQVFRKALSYLSFKIIPIFETVDIRPNYHSLVNELFTEIPRVIEDPEQYKEGSDTFRITRSERKHGYGN